MKIDVDAPNGATIFEETKQYLQERNDRCGRTSYLFNNVWNVCEEEPHGGSCPGTLEVRAMKKTGHIRREHLTL